MGFYDLFSSTIGIDPGSSTLKIVSKGNVSFCEPAQLSIETSTGKVTAIGHSVKQADGEAIIKPVHYFIRDFYGFEMLLRKATAKEKSGMRLSFKMFLAIPNNTSEVDKRSYRDSAEHANAKEVYLAHQGFLAALSMGILTEKKDFTIIDFGASKIEIMIFANKIPVIAHGIPFGIWKLKRLFKNHLFRTHGITLKESELEEFVQQTDKVFADREIIVQSKKIPAIELRAVIEPFIALIKDELLEMQELSTHPQRERIRNNGIYLTGGGALLPILSHHLFGANDTLHFSRTPLLDPANGLKIVMEDHMKWKAYLMT